MHRQRKFEAPTDEKFSSPILTTSTRSEPKGNRAPAPLWSHLNELIREQRVVVRNDPENEAKWQKLWELETHRYGAPVTFPKSKARPVESKQLSQPLSIFNDFSEAERKEMMAMLRQAAAGDNLSNTWNSASRNPRLAGQSDQVDAKRASAAAAIAASED